MIDFNTQIHSRHDFEATLSALRTEIEAAEMMVLHEIDTSAIIRRAGVESRGIRQLLFFHPRYMKRVIETDARAVVEAPLKLVVLEYEDGGAKVVYLSPKQNFGRYVGLEGLADELDVMIGKIANSVV